MRKKYTIALIATSVVAIDLGDDNESEQLELAALSPYCCEFYTERNYGGQS